jgi:4'-phosphopantetheinyl transferase
LAGFRRPGYLAEMRTEPVRLWYLLDDAVAGVAGHEGLSSLLSGDERERARRFHFHGDRDRFVTGRVLARLMLSETDATPPSDWVFSIDDRGRPHVSGRPPGTGPAFSITHTAGLVACAVALWGEVGVDAESAAKPHDLEAIAARFFAPRERALLGALPAEERPRGFYAVWTLKEAFLKARGDGITVPLDRFAFDPFPSPPAFSCDVDFEADPSSWTFRSWWPTREHAMAVALRGTGVSAGQVAAEPVSPDYLADLLTRFSSGGGTRGGPA